MLTTKTYKRALQDGDVSETFSWISNVCANNGIDWSFMNQTVNFIKGTRRTLVTLRFKETTLLENASMHNACRYLYTVTNIHAWNNGENTVISLFHLHDYEAYELDENCIQWSFYTRGCKPAYRDLTRNESNKLATLLRPILWLEDALHYHDMQISA